MNHCGDDISTEALRSAIERRKMSVECAQDQFNQAAERLKREKNMLRLSRKRLKFRLAGKDSRIWLIGNK